MPLQRLLTEYAQDDGHFIAYKIFGRGQWRFYEALSTWVAIPSTAR